jgi:hypothetical protein
MSSHAGLAQVGAGGAGERPEADVRGCGRDGPACGCRARVLPELRRAIFRMTDESDQTGWMTSRDAEVLRLLIKDMSDEERHRGAVLIASNEQAAAERLAAQRSPIPPLDR